jgi:hypothetical protein
MANSVLRYHLPACCVQVVVSVQHRWQQFVGGGMGINSCPCWR